MDHPTHLFRHRHSPVIPMFAHAPPKDPPDTTLRALLPHQTMLPLFLFVRDERGGDDDWVMVEPAAGSPRAPTSKASTSVAPLFGGAEPVQEGPVHGGAGAAFADERVGLVQAHALVPAQVRQDDGDGPAGAHEAVDQDGPPGLDAGGDGGHAPAKLGLRDARALGVLHRDTDVLELALEEVVHRDRGVDDGRHTVPHQPGVVGRVLDGAEEQAGEDLGRLGGPKEGPVPLERGPPRWHGPARRRPRSISPPSWT